MFIHRLSFSIRNDMSYDIVKSRNITNRDWDCGDATPPNPAAVREHHLFPLFADDRKEFSTPRLHETMTLLGSDKGLLATANLLKSSGALTSNGRPEMPSIPSEVDIADTTDEEAPD